MIAKRNGPPPEPHPCSRAAPGYPRPMLRFSPCSYQWDRGSTAANRGERGKQFIFHDFDALSESTPPIGGVIIPSSAFKVAVSRW